MKYAIDFAILLLLYILYFYKRWKAQGKEIVFIRTTMYGSVKDFSQIGLQTLG